MSKVLRSHKELRVYQNAMELAMEIYHLTKEFPPEEKYSLVDQIRRSSRSVCANIAEAMRKRRYQAAFVAKLNDAEGEACETQVWIELAYRCNYLDHETSNSIEEKYNHVISQLIKMVQDSEKWTVK